MTHALEIEKARRERLLKFIGEFYSEGNLRRIVFDGYGQRGISITPADLTDDALERFAQELRSSFWFTRKLNRENRARRRTA